MVKMGSRILGQGRENGFRLCLTSAIRARMWQQLLAQNIGIRYFIDLGYDFVLFADQDSIASEKVVDKLLENHQALKEASIKVGAVGTRAINRQTGLPYVEKSNEIRIIDKRVLSNTSNITECYSIMSSISLIPCKVFNIVGGFDESLLLMV